jgi:hypothetical protein
MCYGAEDRDALYRVFRNIIAMNRDKVSFVSNIDVAPVNPFHYEEELSEKDL